MTKKPMTEAELKKFASEVEVELEKLHKRRDALVDRLIEIIAPEDDEVAFSAVWRLAMTLVYVKFGEGASDAMVEVLRGFAPKNDNEDATYALREGEKQSLNVRQVATGSDVQILPPDEVVFFGLTFSPDANYIDFVRSAKNNPTNTFLYRMGFQWAFSES